MPAICAHSSGTGLLNFMPSENESHHFPHRRSLPAVQSIPQMCPKLFSHSWRLLEKKNIIHSSLLSSGGHLENEPHFFRKFSFSPIVKSWLLRPVFYNQPHQRTKILLSVFFSALPFHSVVLFWFSLYHPPISEHRFQSMSIEENSDPLLTKICELPSVRKVCSEVCGTFPQMCNSPACLTL